MPQFILYISLLLLFYTYFGYPLMLMILSLFIHQEVKRAKIFPGVTIIIPVYNEEGQIGKKIENCLSFDYPKDRLKIIVVSDCSTDRTEEIVKSFKTEQIQLLSLDERKGKVAAQNHAIPFADSEIIIFTDVAITNNLDCIKLTVENFNDEEIGAVSCRDQILLEDNSTKGESVYINYDMMVRKYSSNIGSIIGVTGGFYAVRKELAQGGWDPAFPPDFYVALKCIQSGLRVVEDPRVIAYYKTASREDDEFKRKVRTLNRGMHALFSNKDLLNYFQHDFVSIQLLSHKLLRWMTPFFLITLFLSNLLVWNHSFYTFSLLIIQLAIYLLSIIALLGNNRLTQSRVFKLLIFFCMANLAVIKAWYEFFTGKKYVMWEPTKR